MGEQTALADPQSRSQPANRKSFEPFERGKVDGLAQDRAARFQSSRPSEGIFQRAASATLKNPVR